MKKFIIIQTTYPSLIKAKKLARILLKEKLAACIHFSKIDSCYIWENKIVNDKEILVSIKTQADFFIKIEKIIIKNHTYQVPQIVAINIDKGSKSYLNWIDSNTENKK